MGTIKYERRALVLDIQFSGREKGWSLGHTVLFCEGLHIGLVVFRQYGTVPECERDSHLCKSLSSGQSSKQLIVLFFSKEGEYTDKKENPIFLIFKEIQSGAKSYMRNGYLIYEEMRKYFPIYEEAVIHI